VDGIPRDPRNIKESFEWFVNKQASLFSSHYKSSHTPNILLLAGNPEIFDFGKAMFEIIDN
jgi:hypothetical protein